MTTKFANEIHSDQLAQHLLHFADKLVEGYVFVGEAPDHEPQLVLAHFDDSVSYHHPWRIVILRLDLPDAVGVHEQ